MGRIGWSTGVAAVAASALAGCQAKPPPGPDPAPKPVAAAGSPRFAEISAICPRLPANLQAVKIQITDVAPKHLGHVTALFEANKDGTASTDKKLKDLPEVVFQGQNPTRLDLDAADLLKKPGDVLLVEVELADPAASFAPGPAAVTAGNDDGAAILCLKSKDQRIDPKPSDRTVRFYVQYVASKTPRYGKFNIFLLLKDGPYLTPTVLDPKIHESG